MVKIRATPFAMLIFSRSTLNSKLLAEGYQRIRVELININRAIPSEIVPIYVSVLFTIKTPLQLLTINRKRMELLFFPEIQIAVVPIIVSYQFVSDAVNGKFFAEVLLIPAIPARFSLGVPFNYMLNIVLCQQTSIN